MSDRDMPRDAPGDVPGLDPALARALRAAGTPAELADEQRYLEMFRAGSAAGRAPARHHHAVRRIGAGSALALALAVGGGGVAAAFTGSLPEPLQRATHRVLGPVGVPPAPAVPTAKREREPETNPPSRTPEASPRPSGPTSSAAPTPRPQPQRSESRGPEPTVGATTDEPEATQTPSASPTPTPGSAAPSQVPTPTGGATPTTGPTTSPTADPTAGSTPDPSATPTPVLVADEITISAASHRLGAGRAAVFTGTVSAGDGSPVARATVALEQRGPRGWRQVDATRSDADGDVRVTSPTVLRNTAFRLRVGELTSEVWRTPVRPVVTAAAAVGSGSVLVSVTVLGGNPGDQVRLLATRDRTRVVDRASLDDSGAVVLEIASKARPATYRVVVVATDEHLAAGTTVGVPTRERPGRGR